MTGDISLKATALAGIIEVYNNTWNYLDCQIYPEFKNNNDTEIASYNSTDAQNSNTKLNNVVKALYLYNEAAKQYSMEIE